MVTASHVISVIEKACSEGSDLAAFDETKHAVITYIQQDQS